MTEQKKRRRNDFILIGAILLAAALGLALIKLKPSGGANLAVVTVNDVPYAALPLDEDAQLLITNEKGETNLLVIKAGKAWVERADCRNQVCVHTGKISEEGQIIVCLPHKVVITIESSQSQ